MKPLSLGIGIMQLAGKQMFVYFHTVLNKALQYQTAVVFTHALMMYNSRWIMLKTTMLVEEPCSIVKEFQPSIKGFQP